MNKAALVKEIKSRVTLSSVVKSAVELRGSGPNFVGLCPFHQEKTPSFHVRDQVARFKCFGCGASGDVLEFVMRLRGIAFNEAIRELADKASIELERPTRASSPKVVNMEAELLRAQNVAQEYFLRELSDEKSGSLARKYLLHERRLGEKMIRQAGLGFGGQSKDEFFAFLKKRGVSEKCAIDAGLVKKGRFSLVPQFISRITFPIRNFEGQIIAFGGRKFLNEEDEGPKYVNTHSYCHYEKRKTFYGLYESKNAILKGTTPFLVEGYFDAMALWALGRPALALCGTALSLEHVSLLKRTSARLILCFDSDDAGISALKNALVELYRKDINPALVMLDKNDPGAYLADGSLAELEKVVREPIDALCFLIDRAAINARDNINERIRQIDALLPLFASLKRPLVRRQYVAYLAKTLHEDPALLWTEIGRRVKPEKASNTAKGKEQALTVLDPSERLLLQVIMADPALMVDMADLLSDVSESARAVIKVMAELLPLGSADTYGRLKAAVQALDAAMWPTIEEVLRHGICLSEEEAKKSLDALKEKRVRQQGKEALKKKRAELQHFEKKRDFSSVLKSLKEQSSLLLSKKPLASVQQPKPLEGQKDSPKPMTGRTATRGQPVNARMIGGLDDEATFFDPAEDWI